MPLEAWKTVKKDDAHVFEDTALPTSQHVRAGDVMEADGKHPEADRQPGQGQHPDSDQHQGSDHNPEYDHHPEYDHNPVANPFAHVPHPQKRAFLESYAVTGSVRQAAKVAGVAASMNAYWQRTDAEYKRLFDFARDGYVDVIESRMFEIASQRKDPNVTAMIFSLKGRRRDVYGDHVRVEETKTVKAYVVFDPKAHLFSDGAAPVVDVPALEVQNDLDRG